MGLIDELNERKKKVQGASSDTSSGFGSLMDELETRKNPEYVSPDRIDQDYIESFITDANSFLGSAEEDFKNLGWGNATSLYDSKNSTWEKLKPKAYAIRNWLDQNKGSMDEETYNNFSSYLGEINNVVDTFKSASDFYSQWDSEDAYKQWDATTGEGLRLKSAALSADDFEEYVQKGNETSKSRTDAFLPEKIEEYISNSEEREKFVRRYGLLSTITPTNLIDAASDVVYEDFVFAANMTDDEYNTFAYYYGKYGKEKAQEYLDKIKHTLRSRRAEKIADRVDDSYIASLLFAADRGFVQFHKGIFNFFSNKDYYDPSVLDIASSMVREGLADDGFKLPDWLGGGSIGQAGYDLFNTTGNVIPSMLLGLIPYAGTVLGPVSMGISAAGNAYAEKINLGLTKGQARTYSTLVGAAEGALQYFLGGIGKLGGKASSKVITKVLSKIDNAFARTAINFGGKMAAEGVEEAIQEVLDPVFKSIATGEDFEGIDLDQVLYSGLLGALTAGVLEGGSTISGEVNTYKAGKAVQEAGGIERLTELGSSFSMDTVAHQLAGRVNESTGAYTIGRLFQEVGATVSEQNAADIAAGLEEKGMSRKTAKKLAKQYQSFLNGEMKLTDDQVAVLENLDPLSDVLRKNIIGRNTTVYQRTRAYTDVMNAEKIAADVAAPLSNEELARRRALAESGDFEAIAREIASQGSSTSVNTQNAAERKFATSDDGKTVLIDTNEEIEIQGIASIKDGKVKLRTNKGEVDAEDISFGTDNEALLYEAVTDMTPEAARNMIDSYNPSARLSTGDYVRGFKDSYRYGYFGFPETELAKGVFTKALSEAQRHIAYTVGKNAGEAYVNGKQTARTEAKENGDKTAPKKGKVFINGKEYKLGDKTFLGKLRDASVRGTYVLAEALGVNVYFYESYVNKEGKRVYRDENGNVVHAPHGKYDPKTGYIYIDLNAGKAGEGLIMYTVAHELTHFIRDWSPAKFKIFADFLLENYAKKGVSVEALVQEQIQKAAKNGREISFDEAYEEVIADSCQAMLADGKAIQKIAELKAKDATLWQKIKSFITDIVAKIKRAYAGLDPYSAEGRFVKNQLDVFEQLQTMWTEALIDASETYSAIGGMVQADASSKSVAPMLSERTWTESEYAQAREATAKKMSKDLSVSLDTAYKYIDDINSVARLISDDRARLDYEPNLDSSATVIKPNSDYKWSVDMSTLCAKRLLFTGTFDAIQRALPNTAFDSDDIVRIRGMMEERGYEVACGICYVESTRREIGTITADFIERYKEAQKTGKPITRINSEGKAVELRKTKDQMTTTADASTNQFFADKDYTPTLAELNTTDIDLVKRDHPLVYEAYLNYMNARGQAKPKLLETRAEYKGEILKHFKYKSAVTSRNNAGGLRLQSFSDFEVPHLIDMMQITMDMARVGLKSQAYTKVPNFAEAFGNTGIKINLSLIAKGTGLDADGNLIFDDKEGINHTEAFRLREKFSKNVGTILVGKNDAHIIAAMADPRIDYIIPFHKSSWKESLYDALGLTGYDNYETTQHEKPIDGSRAIKDFDPSEYWDFSKTGDENAQIYLEKCREDGRIPKFPQFQGYEGYWKLLIDFKMYDNDGVGSPQEVVQPIFDNAVNEKILAEYEGGHRSFPEAKDVVEDFVKEKKKDMKLSDRDSAEANERREKAVEEFGYTPYFYDAGYILPNGRMLNFSGEKGKHFGARGEDHRAIARVFDDATGGSAAMLRFMGEGNVRLSVESQGIDLGIDIEPTVSQYNTISRFITDCKKHGYFYVDFTDVKGNVVGTLSYERKIDNAEIIYDIKDYFKTGKVREQNNGIRYSDRDFADQVDAVLSGADTNSSHLKVMDTPKLLQDAGLPNLPILMTANHLKKITSASGHGLDVNLVKKLPEYISDPVMIADSLTRGDSVVIITEALDSNRKPVIAAIILNGTGRLDGNHIDANIMASAYGKDNFQSFLNRIAESNSVIYWNEKKSQNLSVSLGLQLPNAMTSLSSNSIIHQAKAFVKGKTENSDNGVKLSDRDSYAPVFYSHMGKVIDDIKIAKMGAGGVVPYLKGKGVKNEEIKWSGIEAFLEGKKSVTKEDLQQFVAGSQLQIVEQMSGEDIDLRYNGSDRAYTLYDSNGEVVDTFTYNEFMDGYVAESDEEIYSNEIELREALLDMYGKASAPKWEQYKLDGGTNYRELVFQMPNSSYSNRAMRGHWGQDAEGVLVHARVQDFDTSAGKMLFVEELQSDWHNEGHEKGYTTETYEDAVESRDKLYDEYKKLDVAFHKYVRSNEFMTDPEDVRKKKHDWLRGKVDAAQKKHLDAEKVVNSLKENGMGDVPDAPFRDTYHEYVMKRLIRMAAEEGYDIIGWTPSEIQVDRWSEEYAEGYRIEYDQDIPKFLRKYGKRWGATVGNTTINGDTQVWSMPITDSMKQSVLTEGQPLYSDRSDSDISNRELLANSLESAATDDIERNKLAQYKEKIALINAEEQKLHELKAEIGELSFAKGKKDVERIKKLQFEAKQAENRINTYDRQLLSLEASAPLKAVLEREKKLAYKKAEKRGKDALAAYREKAAADKRKLLERAAESRKKGIEGRRKTEMRHKIRKVVSDLDHLLRHGSKERNVKLGLQAAVASALEAVNMDTVAADERIAKLEKELMQAKTPEKIQEISRKIDHIREQGDRMASRLEELRRAYVDIKNSEKGVPDYYKHEATLIADKVDSVMKKVGDTPIRNMSLAQLEEVYNLYQVVLTTVRNTNSVFIQGKLDDLHQNASAIMQEEEAVKPLKEERLALGDWWRKQSWSEMIPAYAFERLGSKTLTKFFWETIKGQNTFATDISEAKAFSEAARKKFGYAKWDLNKIHEFKLEDGRTFRVSLRHMMSIYAYSKREQALDHMRVGGFFFNDKKPFSKKKGILKVIKSNEAGYTISEDVFQTIKAAMTQEQLQYVDEMQDYLTKMGEKGNEVSRVLWGIDIFKEKVYFPLKSSRDFIYQANQPAQESSLKNDGMTKETIPHASNPIVLEEFDDVWASHIERMSKYHAFVLPIENLNKLMNYGTWVGTESMSVSTMIRARHSDAANEYITQFIRDLNGASSMDGVSNPVFGFFNKFKKTAVAASLSVVVQQPTAVLRAAAVLDARYFVGKPTLKKLSSQWNELQKYAPIATIKDIGGFDAGGGRQITDWLNADTKRGLDKVMGKIDDITMLGTALGDQFGWCTIWDAVKRETLHNNPKLSPKSEEFLQKAGDRFTEVIVLTQVYDSTLSRSGFMRSKHESVKMMTSFMGEPTVSFNMLMNAVLQVKNKKITKRQAARTVGAVYASVLAASVVASMVYALRDDDEDEAYLEKFAEALSGKLKDETNPLNMLPIMRDIMSIFDGWDVERTDVAIFKDLKDAFDGLFSENKSAWRKVEDFAGAIASLFGIPLKNTLRTGREIYNFFENIFDGVNPTGAGIKDSIAAGVTGNEKSNGQQLYEAILNGDQKQIDRVSGRFKDQTAIDTAIRKALRDNDPRIKEAAQAIIDEDYSKYTEIANEMVNEGYFSEENIVAAIKSQINAMTKEDEEETEDAEDKEVSIYEMDYFYSAVVGGDTVMAHAIREDIIRTKVANGKDRDEAEKSFNTSFQGVVRDEYDEGSLSDSEAIQMLVSYGGKTEAEAQSKVQYWDFKRDNPDTYVSEYWIDAYNEDVASSGVSLETFIGYKNAVKDIEGDGAKAKKMAVIDSLPITNAQKDALYYAEGWAASKLYEAPWR